MMLGITNRSGEGRDVKVMKREWVYEEAFLKKDQDVLQET
jgi:hypothetical protein